MTSASKQTSHPTRRTFLKASASAAAVTTTAHLLSPSGVRAAGSDVLKVGLIGCGGRGTGAATQALNADKNIKLVAMGDAFEDRLQSSLAQFRRDKGIAAKVDVQPDRCHVGFDAYKQVIDGEVDVVLLATPPGFRPIHLCYAVGKGKHVFAEKPVAVDAPGVRSALEATEVARKKSLSLVVGLQTRYSTRARETMKRIHEGMIGDLVALQANDYRGPIWVKTRQPGWTDMVYQMRNWYYYTWLSGDFNVEQHVHMIDTCAWAMNGEYPKRCSGTGGRQVRTGPEYGHIFDHFAVVYEYANGVKLFATCRQQKGCANDISAHFLGTKGQATLGRITTASETWEVPRNKDNVPVQAEHDALFASIRDGKPINNGEYGAKSTLMTIMGRMAGYTGQVITWEMAMNSKEDLSPPAYDWNVRLPKPPVALPGVTQFA
jgi:predicted dehydrogenase